MIGSVFDVLLAPIEILAEGISETIGTMLDLYGPLAILPAIFAYLIMNDIGALDGVQAHEGANLSVEEESENTVSVQTRDGRLLKFERDAFSPRRVQVGDSSRWLADHEGEPVEIDAGDLPFDPAERTRQAFVGGEIDEDEMERRLGHDMELEVEDVE